MIVFVVPAVLAGLLGLVANGAEGAEAYIPKLRLLFLGAASLGYLGLAAFVWLKTRGWRRWGALVVGLAAVRVAYLPVIATALVVTGWLDWLGRMFGVEKLAAPVHYALACFVAALAGLVALAATKHASA